MSVAETESARGVAPEIVQRWAHRDRDTLVHLREALGLGPVRDLEDDGDDVEVEAWATENRSAIRVELEGSGRVDVLDDELDLVVVAVEVYFTALRRWERTSDHDSLERFITHACDWLEAQPSRSPLIAGISALLASLPAQMATENARFCACPFSLTVSAEQVCSALDGVSFAVDRARSDGALLVAAVLEADRRNVVAFYGALAQHVGPMATMFAEGLVNPAAVASPDPPSPHASADGAASPPREAWRDELDEQIHGTLPALRSTAQRLIRSGDVLGTELRANANALAEIKECLGRDTLLLTGGQLVFLYPFTAAVAPIVDPGRGDIRQRVEIAGEPAPVRLDSVVRTDAWEQLMSTTELLGDAGALRLPSGWNLRLRPAWALNSVDVVVVLGKGDQHYVKIVASIGPVASDDDVEGVADLDSRTEMMNRGEAWTGHDCDQWIRRLTQDAGRERVEVLTGIASPADVVSFDTISDFVEALVRGIVAAVDSSKGAADEPDLLQLNSAVVVFVVDDAVVLAPTGETRPWEAGDRLADLVGFSAITTGHRYLPAAVEEWVAMPVPPVNNLLEGLTMTSDSLFVSGEVIALFARWSPNWLVIEQIEMIEFAVSARAGLVTLAGQIGDTRSPGPDVVALGPGLSAHIDEVSARIEQGWLVLDLIRARELVRSPYHRTFLDRALGALGLAEIERRVVQSLESLTEYRTGLVERRRHDDSMVLNYRVEALTVVALFAAIDPLIVSVTGRDGVGAHAIGALISLVLTLMISWLATAIGRRRLRGSG